MCGKRTCHALKKAFRVVQTEAWQQREAARRNGQLEEASAAMSVSSGQRGPGCGGDAADATGSHSNSEMAMYVELFLLRYICDSEGGCQGTLVPENAEFSVMKCNVCGRERGEVEFEHKVQEFVSGI
jgi:hypothetical protein